MKHIDHIKASVSGNKITDNYLSVCFNQQTRMHSVDYDSSFRVSGKRGEMIQLLGRLQNNLCCYCMRKLQLNSAETTLEHIIPQSIGSTVDMQPYFNLGYPNLLAEHLIASREFSSLRSPSIPPRPHTVAYFNFTLSCNGTFLPDGISVCCNNYRQDKFINPVFFNPDIEQQVTYNSDGKIYPVHGCHLFAEITDLIVKTRLNYKELVEIRKIWHALSNITLKEIEEKNTEPQRKRLLLINLTGNIKEINKLADKYKINQRWKTLMSYSWFHQRIK